MVDVSIELLMDILRYLSKQIKIEQAGWFLNGSSNWLANKDQIILFIQQQQPNETKKKNNIIMKRWKIFPIE